MTALHLVPADVDAELDQLEEDVAEGLMAAVASLTRLRELEAHKRRGYDLWWRYLDATFGDLLALLRLPEGELRALVDSMSTPTAEHPKGLPVRGQSKLAGVAPGTIQAHRRALGLVVVKDRPEPLPAPEGKVWQQTAEWLRRHPDGLTLVELARVAHWTEGKASGALSDVCRRGLATRTEDRRVGQRVHQHTEEGQ